MTQEFHGQVGEVAGRDIVNHHHSKGRPLTKDERRSLNNYVKQLEDEYGESGKQTWTSIHRILGNDNIEEMSIEQIKPTEAILQLLLSNAQLKRQAASAGNDPDLTVKLRLLADQLSSVIAERDKIKTQLVQYHQAYTSLEKRFKSQTRDLEASENKYSRLMDAADEVSQINERNKAAVSALANVRHSVRRLRILALLAFAAAATGGYGTYAFREKALTAQSALNGCAFDGKPYSVGSIIDNPQAPDIQCVAMGSGRRPEWQQTSNNPKARSKH
ncbi:hypothetical protein [Pandoraea norimbergensis]|uniref:Uncharacterized protein n=1 Tax=Pandoraea norimbergensis TaxID=93219 RepID=A0ABN4JPP0_9BURK|nr:hypothetical protein [Pandoraea norimbergensis]ALS60686.1 hypothetical protein AT302_13800 [Pandoraea norimbergensis]ALS61973.1 hypothetical protein AT302_21505 [Pandoraea norimbergensis]